MALDIAKELKNRTMRLQPMNRYFSKPKEFLECKIKFYIKCLDLMAGGIRPTDFFIMSAPSGHGKTQIGSYITTENVLANKEIKIAYFALEAYAGEIEDRIKWHLMLKELNKQNSKGFWRYDEWLDGLYKNEIEINNVEIKVIEDYSEIMTNRLFTSYVDEKYTLKEFEEDLEKAKNHYQCDLVVLDHLHFFDLVSNNENQEMKALAKRICISARQRLMPVLCIAHIRKGLQKLAPEMDDIHGSSDISKIATGVITFAHAKDIEKREEYLVPTYFKVVKTRKRGGMDFYIALCDYNLQTVEYEKDFNIYYTNYDGTKLVEIKNNPYWYSYVYKRK